MRKIILTASGGPFRSLPLEKLAAVTPEQAAFFERDALIAANGGKKGELAQALGGDWKSRVSLLIYATAIALTFFAPIVSCVLYAAVAAMWFVPDRRIESKTIHS